MPSRKGQVCAFLRLKEKDVGPLDFDAPGGLDTTWHRVFFCLRSGFQAEALEVSVGSVFSLVAALEGKNTSHRLVGRSVSSRLSPGSAAS